MSRRSRPHYRPGLEWILGVAFPYTLTRPVRLAQGLPFVRCCGSSRASSPHGLRAGVSRRRRLRAVAFGSRLLPSRPAKDFHLKSSAHARHTRSGYALPSSSPRRRILILIVARFFIRIVAPQAFVPCISLLPSPCGEKGGASTTRARKT